MVKTILLVLGATMAPSIALPQPAVPRGHQLQHRGQRSTGLDRFCYQKPTDSNPSLPTWDFPLAFGYFVFHAGAHDDFQTMPQPWALLWLVFCVIVNGNHLDHTDMPPQAVPRDPTCLIVAPVCFIMKTQFHLLITYSLFQCVVVSFFNFSDLQMPQTLHRSYRTQQKKEVPYNHSLRMLTLHYLFSVKNWSKRLCTIEIIGWKQLSW